MSGYIRQSAADIVTGEVVAAAPLNDEFDALAGAFHSSTGHTHDGTSGNAPAINLTSSVTGILPTANGGTGGPTGTPTFASLTLTTGLTITVDTTSTNEILITSTDDGAVNGPGMAFFRDSASPAVNDVMGAIRFNGNDSGGNLTGYASISATIIDPTNGSEDARIIFQGYSGGTTAGRLYIGAGVTLNNTLVDKGVGTLNATALYINGETVPAMYTGSDMNEDTYPPGTILYMNSENNEELNSLVHPVALSTDGTNFYWIASAVPSVGTYTSVNIIGEWAVRGLGGDGGISGHKMHLIQRTS